MAASSQSPGPGLSAARSPRPLALSAIALAGGVAGAASVVLTMTGDAESDVGEPLVIALLSSWLTISYVICGVIAWARRPASRFGPLMIAAGFASFLTDLSWLTSDLPYTIGQALDLLPPVLFLHVFLAFPSGRLQGSFDRVLLAAAYATAVGLQLLRMSFGGFGPSNLLEVATMPGAAEAVMQIMLVALGAFCVTGVGVLVVRRRRDGRRLRRSRSLLVNAFGLGLVMMASFLVSHVVGADVPELRWATFATLGIAPLVFLIGLLNDRLARSAVGGLVVELRGDLPPASLRQALARALRDPSLTLAFWLPDLERYADLDGRLVELPDPGGRRAARLIDRNGAPVAALLHDRALTEEPELLDAVTAAAGMALEKDRLDAELRVRLAELTGSRARIVDAGQQERKRLERDLHDGAQQRLIAVSLELGLLEEGLLGDVDTCGRLGQARREIATSLEELRAVARGIHPAVVSGHGLAVALEQLAARAPVPVRLSVAVGSRLPERLEVAAFYLVSEGLANIGKHASATSAIVDVARTNGRIVVEVVDDGIGGADTAQGSGLRGLADRVEALEGQLRIWSPSGGGTRLRAEIPCAQ